jgi:DHA2 family multidrug resistance protein-like MFS transporter
VVLLALGVAFGFVFVRRQRVLPEPLLDLALFAGRAFRTALGNMLFGTMLMGAIMVFTTQYLQLVGGLTPLQAGLWMLPGVVASVASSLLSPLLARRFRPAYVIGIGLVVAVFGLVLVASASSVAAVAVGLTVINLGAGPMVVLGTDLIIGSAPPSKAGSAASLNETCGELGFALGIALLGSLGTAVYRAGVEVPAGVAAPDSLASAVALAERLPIQVGTELLVSAREAFTTGMHVAAWVSAVLMAAVAAFVVPLLRHVRPSDELVETAS